MHSSPGLEGFFEAALLKIKLFLFLPGGQAEESINIYPQFGALSQPLGAVAKLAAVRLSSCSCRLASIRIDHMADEGSPRKAKRTAEHQINKDEDPEGDGVGEEVVAGTFQRAPPEVLKSRK